MSSEKVTFNSQGETLSGVLTRPDNAKGDVPIVVMAGGWCYTKEIVMPYYAKFFQDIGCATLCFDYRNFGESTGEPRQHLNPWEQVEDYRNAFSYAETLKGIDIKRSGIWGIS
jgi:dipeptidyl aminopeptidase/acylaminoacyl peptidase